MTTPSGTGVTGPIGVVAHYNLLEALEPSGPGELYRARDTRLGRTVTVRLLPHGYTASTAARQELIAQARSMTALSHPNVITLFDAGEHDGRVYLVFEFLQGQSLRAGDRRAAFEPAAGGRDLGPDCRRHCRRPRRSASCTVVSARSRCR